MFTIGDYVVCGIKGVCTVEDVTTLSITGVDKEREFYILKPLSNQGSTIYVPVDSGRESVRAVIASDEAEKILEGVTDMEVLEIINDKYAEQTYKEYMKACDCLKWARMLKTIYRHQNKRIMEGRKMTAVDTKYSHIVEDSLFGELAVALKVEKQEIADRFTKAINYAYA